MHIMHTWTKQMINEHDLVSAHMHYGLYTLQLSSTVKLLCECHIVIKSIRFWPYLSSIRVLYAYVTCSDKLWTDTYTWNPPF